MIMNKIILFLQSEMDVPKPWGIFHLLWICLVIVSILYLNKIKGFHNEKQLKIVLATYSITALILELIKQIIWSANIDLDTNIITWDYPWYIFPFQFCTTPLYVCLICVFLKNNKIRNTLLSYVAFYTILGSFMTMLLPDSCFVSTIEVNIHTMCLHCGSFVISVYLLLSKEVKVIKENYIKGFVTFIAFVFIVNIINIIIFNSGILRGEEFNMFYISPYFVSSLPVFNTIQQNVPYLLFLILYIFAIGLGSYIVFATSKLIKNIKIKNIFKLKHKIAC